MTLVREYQPTFVLGDGETKEFPYLFEEVSENFIKVIVKHSDDSTYVPVFSVDLDSHKVVFGESETAPLNTDVVCIYRNTPDLQDTPFRTLQGYDAKALENILSKIVAMIQELKANGFSTQILQGTPWQLDLLHPADDGASLIVDYNARILKKGLYFQIVSGNLQVSADGSSFITMPKSADITEFRCLETVLEDLTVIRKLQYKVNNVWYDAEHNAQATADEALDLAQTVQGDLSSHKLNHNNPHETSLSNLTDTDFTNLQTNQFLKFNGTKWVNVYSSAVASWGNIIGNITDQTDLMNKFSEYVKTDGTSIMTAPLKFRAGSMRGAVGPYLNGVSFWKLDSQGNITNIANLTDSQFLPVTTNAIDLGRSANQWKDLYLAGKAYMSVINNGYDIAVPVTNSADTFALKSEVDLAANSGRMLTDQGVWYAKMYAATVAPSAEDGTNYADFSQVDSDNNPVIKIYTGASGSWTLTETITPPADYDGYVSITSKIWDIVEQSGQQGGRVLWNHQSKDFTPYPQIISFENAALTGVPTAPLPTDASPNNQIATKEYVDEAIAEIPTGGSGLNVGDIFLTMRNDNELNGAVECDGSTYNTTDFTGAQSIGALLEAGKLDYVSLSAYSTAISTKGWCDKIGWNGTGNIQFRVPTLNTHIVQTNNIPVIGNGMALGVTDGTTNCGLTNTAISSNNVLYPRTTAYGVNVGDSATGGTQLSTQKGIGVVTDPANSGIIADTSDTAQLRVMIQLATSATDEALETCTSVLADVAALKYDYVVDFQAPTAENNYTWYRKYKSGWVEQGGILQAQTVSAGYAASQTLTLPITMADTNFTVTFGDVSGNTLFQSVTISKTTTGGTVKQMNRSGSGSGSVQFSYVVSGMAASN